MDRQPVLIITKELIADNRISLTARLLLAQLLEHRNKTTGQCNPRETTLAKELGSSRRTVIRKLKELRGAGLIEVKRGRRKANNYEIKKCQIDTSGGAKLALLNSRSLYEPYLIEPTARGRAALPPRKDMQREVLARYYATYGRKAGS
jgi:DNA-binding transcriptional MocR family regulator